MTTREQRRRYILTYSDGKHHHEYRPMTLDQCKAKIASCVKRYWPGEPLIDYQDWDHDDYIEAILYYPVADDQGRQVATIEYHSEEHISEVRRKAALASAAARAAKSKNRGRRPKSVNIRADVADTLIAYAADAGMTLTDAATEAVEHGLADLRENQ